MNVHALERLTPDRNVDACVCGGGLGRLLRKQTSVD